LGFRSVVAVWEMSMVNIRINRMLGYTISEYYKTKTVILKKQQNIYNFFFRSTFKVKLKITSCLKLI